MLWPSYARLPPLWSINSAKSLTLAASQNFPMQLPSFRDTSSILRFSTGQGKLNTPSDLLLNLTRNRKCHGRIMQLLHWTFPVPSSFLFFSSFPWYSNQAAMFEAVSNKTGPLTSQKKYLFLLISFLPHSFQMLTTQERGLLPNQARAQHAGHSAEALTPFTNTKGQALK